AHIVRLILSGERVNYDGQFFKLKGFTLGMNPVRRSIPTIFASITPAGIRAVGEAADGWEPLWMSAEAIPGHMETIAAAATAAGRDPAAIEVVADLETGVSSSAEMRQRAKAHLAFYIGGMGVYYHQSVKRQGFAAEADAVRAAYLNRERDQAASLVTDAMVDALAVVGDPDACRRRLAQYRAAGANTAILRFLPGQTLRQAEESLEALAPGTA
ncbi:MAG: LLM class flavin-dependent oxidoreductase, partial [Chloroflexi bacterium]|nr:LLM class flavin-dependent oxidoreductase [Chloroflexota bacterium]